MVMSAVVMLSVRMIAMGVLFLPADCFLNADLSAQKLLCQLPALGAAQASDGAVTAAAGAVRELFCQFCHIHS